MTNKNKLLLGLLGILLMSLLFTGAAGACRKLGPLVSTDWLLTHGSERDVVIIDIRSAAEYEAGHIGGAISAPFEVPYSAWSAMRGELLLELPDQSELFNTIGLCGITKNSRVVVVTSGPAEPPYSIAAATRVALTLIYAGVKDVAVLDGGYAKWLAESKPVTTTVPVVSAVTWLGEADEGLFVSVEYIHERIGKAMIIDARDTDVYNGTIVEAYTAKPGHISTAISLPARLLWNEDGTYRPSGVLWKTAKAAIGKQKPKEIILYCGAGGYASSWWYVLTRVLGFKNVKIFDGSAQEWGIYYDMVL
jgi:thiosulfate/3-mercaptopyruvate sulfurtransferase